jgi:hypothetical protein
MKLVRAHKCADISFRALLEVLEGGEDMFRGRQPASLSLDEVLPRRKASFEWGPLVRRSTALPLQERAERTRCVRLVSGLYSVHARRRFDDIEVDDSTEA